jgi:sigma-B regulation protein RsbU (phosphoserine phosphatase)
MKPFLKSFPAWQSRQWLLALFLLLSPGAFLVGRYFQVQLGHTSIYRMEGYREIVMRARATAKALGIPAANWRATIRFTPGPEMNRFAQRERARIPPAVLRVLPVAVVRVLMLEGQGKWVEFTYSGEGHLLGYEASAGIFAANEMLAHTGTREVAQSALEAVADSTAFEFGDASSTSSDGGMAQRFEWSLRAKCCPELMTTAAVEVVGRRPSFLKLSTSFESDYLHRRNTPLNLLADVFRIGFMLAALVFVGFRFAKRAMEHEVPYKRAAVIWGVVLSVGTVFTILQPFGDVKSDETGLIAGPFWYAGVILGVLIYLVFGMLMALAYGATEGDLREMRPGKLTSLDALLSGRLLSQNVGVSLVAGASLGAWAYGLAQMARAWVAPGFIPLHDTELQYSYSAAPWLGLIGSNVAGAIQMTIIVLLITFSMGNWLGRTSRQRRVITLLCSLGAVAFPGSPFVDANSELSAITRLALLWLGFGAFDLLAALAAGLVIMSGVALADMQAIMPAWRTPAVMAFGVGTGALTLALFTAFRGRRYQDAEVMPAYARNIAERQSRRQEVSATREAQLRLLPDRPPNVPGLGIAAFCAPSNHGVSGDFFDFYPMSRGRLGLLVADGRTGGLGAALTIALAKGFVQYAAHRDWPVGETLRRLREVWHRDELNLVFAIFDPAHRQIRYARLGPTPVILAGLDTGDKAEPLSGLVSDGLTEGAATFAHGDVVLFYTDGVPERLASSHRDGLDAWLRNKLRLTTGVTAYRIGESLQEALRAHEGDAPDDLTAVVIRFEPAEQARLEVGA